MTFQEKMNYINKKFKEIDEKLKNPNLTNEERQILLEERVELEERFEEIEFDYDGELDVNL